MVNVLKLNGRRIKVADNSLTISMKINIEDKTILNDIIGIWTLKSVNKGFFPKTLETLS